MHEMNKGAYRRKYPQFESQEVLPWQLGLKSIAKKLDSLDPLLPVQDIFYHT